MREDAILPEDELRALFEAVVRERGALTGGRATRREREVLFEWVVRGLNTEEVAGVLVIAVRTVQEHLANTSTRLRYENPKIMYEELFRAFARAEARAEVAPIT